MRSNDFFDIFCKLLYFLFMSILASSLKGVNPKRDVLVLELREYFEQYGGPNWRIDPSDLPITFSDVSSETMLVDVKRADDAWKAPISVNFRITNTGDNEIGDRTEGLLNYIKGGNPVDPPDVYYDPDRRSLDFTNGRHRFALLRDAGVLCIPMNSGNPETLKHLEANDKELQGNLQEAIKLEGGIKEPKRPKIPRGLKRPKVGGLEEFPSMVG